MTKLLFISRCKQLETKEELSFEKHQKALDYLEDNEYTQTGPLKYYKKLPIWEIFVEVKQEL